MHAQGPRPLSHWPPAHSVVLCNQECTSESDAAPNCYSACKIQLLMPLSRTNKSLITSSATLAFHTGFIPLHISVFLGLKGKMGLTHMSVPGTDQAWLASQYVQKGNCMQNEEACKRRFPSATPPRAPADQKAQHRALHRQCLDWAGPEQPPPGAGVLGGCWP